MPLGFTTIIQRINRQKATHLSNWLKALVGYKLVVWYCAYLHQLAAYCLRFNPMSVRVPRFYAVYREQSFRATTSRYNFLVPQKLLEVTEWGGLSPLNW
jgi:hypothetical protein